MNYFCCDDEHRRNTVQAHATLNGIDFLEVRDEPTEPLEDRQRTLLVHFLKDLGPDELKISNLRIDGGERIRNIQVTAVGPSPANAKILIVEVSTRGDFSTYTLRLVTDANSAAPPSGFDPILSRVDFSFKVACPSDFDCKTPRVCPAPEAIQPEINYLAKDYASFRQLMLDRMALLTPQWQERNAADLGIAVVELLAYVGDYLSYQQDAVATEAYLGTARRRTSVRRHARLVDYLMHDGRNARTWVHFEVGEVGDNLLLERGKGENTTKLLTRISGESKTLIRQNLPDFQRALEARPLVFELIHEVTLFQAHNEIKFYTWDSRDCCLPKGSTRATLIDDPGRCKLRQGDVLIFEEKVDPASGIPGDADPSHRHAVLLTKVHPEASLTVVDGTQLRTAGTLVTDPLTGVAIVEIEWASADALPFSLCISAETEAGHVENISVALGNIALADHGMTFADARCSASTDLTTVDTSLVPDTVPPLDPALKIITPSSAGRCTTPMPVASRARYRPRLKQAPLTHAAPFHADALSSATAAIKLAISDHLQMPLPCVWLSPNPCEPNPERWMPVRDLLASHANGKEFCVEVETDGTTYIRFGDDVLGAHPLSGTRFFATYRIGNGAAGNVGADTLAHLVSSTLTDPKAVIAVRNPLRAAGGLESETIEQVRQNAPSAFRTQERAVTPADYEEIATRKELNDRSGIDLQRVAATPRWTGSWYTMFVSADRFGGAEVDRDFEDRLRASLERYRMVGDDLEVDTPSYVSLEIEIALCLKPGYYFSDVQKTVLDVFSDRVLPNNRRGLFHPDNLSFGQTVYLSALIAAAQAVAGVESVMVRKFQRQHDNNNDALRAGKLELGRLEIARLNNDPNFPERGSFVVTHG